MTLHIESAAGRSLGGSTSIAPHSAGDLTIWIDAPLPRSMGMIGGPSLKAAGLSPNLPVTATKGSINSAQVTSVRLGIWRPAAPQALTVGRLCVDSPSEVDKTAYDRIVDSFGQLSHGIWPEKVSSDEMLRARGAEEANQLAQRRDEPLKRDRFGGLEESASFARPDFFEQNDGTAGGGSSRLRGILFSRSAWIPSCPMGRPISTAVSSCSAICRREMANSPRTGARSPRSAGAARSLVRSWTCVRFPYGQPRAQVRRRVALALA